MRALRKKVFAPTAALLGLLGLTAGLRANDLTTSLLAHYPFDGNAEDISGNGNHLTLHGNPVIIPSSSGGGIRFDGQDDYASRNKLLTNTPFTWALWAPMITRVP